MYIVGLKAFENTYNNYIWCIHQTSMADKQIWVVDPGDSVPVLDFIRKNNKTLVGILITHHHKDHTNGIKDLQQHFPNCKVIASLKTQQVLPNLKIDTLIKHGDEISIFNRTFSIIDTPGHTLDHIAFYSYNDKVPILFSGDTLFTAGCGLLLEGTSQQMVESLIKLRNLPDNTLVYCGHEYTLENINFAIIAEPNNPQILKRQKNVISNKISNTYSVPETLKVEKETNPFLRFDLDTLKDNIYNKRALFMKKNSTTTLKDSELFYILRLWKNSLDKTGVLNGVNT